MVVVSSSGLESQPSGLSLYRFSLMLCRIATRRLCTVFGSRCPGEAPLACRTAPDGLGELDPLAGQLVLELLGHLRADRRDVVLLVTQPARP